MHINDAVAIACKEETLLDALTYIAVWESERVVQQALASNGKSWETFFSICFYSVITRWQAEHDFVDTSGIIDRLNKNIKATSARRASKDSVSI